MGSWAQCVVIGLHSLLQLMDHFFKLHYLLRELILCLYFYDSHIAQCSVDFFLHFELLGEKLFCALLQLCLFFIELFLDNSLFLFDSSTLFYKYSLYLYQSLGGLRYFLLFSSKASFDCISEPLELGLIIYRFWCSQWQRYSEDHGTGL
jgi:hypothetical protein